MQHHRYASWVTAAVISVVVVSASGCVTTETTRSVTTIRVPVPMEPASSSPSVPAAIIGSGLSLGEVVGQIKSGRPQADIATSVRQQGLQGAINAADIDLLLANGAGRELIDAMLQAPRMVTGPIVSPPAVSSTTTVIQSVPVPVVTGSIGFNRGWAHSGFYGGSAWSNPWGWWGPPRVVAPVILAPQPIFRPPVVIGQHPVFVGPGAGAHFPRHGGWHSPGGVGGFHGPGIPQSGFGGFGSRGGSGVGIRVHKN